MPDREKVLTGLERCTEQDWNCDECPYHDAHGKLYECHDKLMMDALELLRKE